MATEMLVFFFLIKVFIKIATGTAQCNKKVHFLCLQPKLLLEMILAFLVIVQVQALSCGCGRKVREMHSFNVFSKCRSTQSLQVRSGDV